MNLPSFKKYKNFPKIDKTLPDKEIKRYLLYLFDYFVCPISDFTYFPNSVTARNADQAKYK